MTRVTRSYSKNIIIIFTILHEVNFSGSILFSLVLFLLLLICFANWCKMSCRVTSCTGLRSCRAMLVTCEMTTLSTSVTIQTLRLITSVTPFGFTVFFMALTVAPASPLIFFACVCDTSRDRAIFCVSVNVKSCPFARSFCRSSVDFHLSIISSRICSFFEVPNSQFAA